MGFRYLSERKFNEDKKNWFKNDNRKKGINRKDTGDVVFFSL